jgi:hypothetical protein
MNAPHKRPPDDKLETREATPCAGALAAEGYGFYSAEANAWAEALTCETWVSRF